MEAEITQRGGLGRAVIHGRDGAEVELVVARCGLKSVSRQRDGDQPASIEGAIFKTSSSSSAQNVGLERDAVDGFDDLAISSLEA